MSFFWSNENITGAMSQKEVAVREQAEEPVVPPNEITPLIPRKLSNEMPGPRDVEPQKPLRLPDPPAKKARAEADVPRQVVPPPPPVRPCCACNGCMLFFLLLALYLYAFYAPARNHWDAYQSNKLAADALFRLNNKTTHAKSGCETTLLIIRHCEDLGGNLRYHNGTKHCSYLGFERSAYLATLFGPDIEEDRWPVPSRLYGLWKGSNVRQYEILEPLSNKSGVPIEMYDFPGHKELVEDWFTLLGGGELCGRVGVVAWKHKVIRTLAASLGCGQQDGCPETWDDYDFDTVLELKYVFQPEKLQANGGKSIGYHSSETVKGWMIFGSLTQEGFDALEFGQDVGDYAGNGGQKQKRPQESSSGGGKWMHHRHYTKLSNVSLITAVSIGVLDRRSKEK